MEDQVSTRHKRRCLRHLVFSLAIISQISFSVATTGSHCVFNIMDLGNRDVNMVVSQPQRAIDISRTQSKLKRKLPELAIDDAKLARHTCARGPVSLHEIRRIQDALYRSAHDTSADV